MNLKNISILAVDDDTDVLTAVRLLLKTEVKEVVIEKKPEQIRQQLSQQRFDIVLLDMNFNSTINTGNEGLFWLKEVKKLAPDSIVVMITAYGDIDLAVRSLKEGASDFVVKPWHNNRLLEVIRENLDRKPGSKPVSQRFQGEDIIVGSSAAMTDLFLKIEKIAPTDANILLLGENGTGKDMLARVIHEQSAHAAGPFVKVDVGSLTESLFESELFGYRKGAFTDAREDRPGRFEMAAGGTLFLDEIGNIPLHLQVKLLSVLQNRMVYRLGSNEPLPVDIRLICATNAALQDLANESRFRKDLLYRINTVELLVPPLRHRRDDILLLANHFCQRYATKYMKPMRKLKRSAIDKLLLYPFPGNVRELQYTIERAVIMAEGEELEATDILFSPIESPAATTSEERETKLSAVEKNTILRVIDKHNGNITKAAKELGLTRTALYRRLSKYDI